jgi:hypothetical protein
MPITLPFYSCTYDSPNCRSIRAVSQTTVATATVLMGQSAVNEEALRTASTNQSNRLTVAVSTVRNRRERPRERDSGDTSQLAR